MKFIGEKIIGVRNHHSPVNRQVKSRGPQIQEGAHLSLGVNLFGHKRMKG